MGNIFDILLVNPFINVLLVFYYVFTLWHLPGAFGWAIIALTSSIRIVFNPFYAKQIEMASKMQEIKPRMSKLQAKYKDDKTKLQQEQMKLYQEVGVNPTAGCLVALVQIPIIFALYNVLQTFLNNGGLEKVSGKINAVVYADFLKVSNIDSWFLWYDLGVNPSAFAQHGYHYLAIPLITGGLQYWQGILAQPNTAPKKDELAETGGKNKNKDKKDEKPSASEDFQKAMSTQMKYMLPVMIGYFSYVLPVGLALYWNVFSLFSILQYSRKK